MRWRRVDLQVRIRVLFGVAMHERPSVNFLATNNWRRSAFGGCRSRPRHPKTDEGAQKAFKKTCPNRVRQCFPKWRRASRSRSGFRSEPDQKTVRGTHFPVNARVSQQGMLTRVWAPRGTRPRAVRDTRYEWAYLFGAACPGRGVAAGRIEVNGLGQLGLGGTLSLSDFEF